MAKKCTSWLWCSHYRQLVHFLAIVQDVPIWNELWRKLNGFPPDYYVPTTASNSKIEKK